MEDVSSEGLEYNVLRELSNLKMTNHPNIVKLHEFFIKNDKIYFVFDFYYYSLRNYMGNTCGLDDNKIKSISFQIFSGLNYLHSIL